MTTRTLAGMEFRCERPGTWLSVDGRYGIYHMMAGLSCEQWEVYESAGREAPIDSSEMIGLGLTMGEAVADAFGN